MLDYITNHWGQLSAGALALGHIIIANGGIIGIGKALLNGKPGTTNPPQPEAKATTESK